VNEFISGVMPGLVILAQVINFLVSFGVVTLLFGLIYKVVPDVKIAWRDVWVGALVTAFLFTVGKFAIGLYLGNSAPGSTYGAAGSLIVLLLWGLLLGSNPVFWRRIYPGLCQPVWLAHRGRRGCRGHLSRSAARAGDQQVVNGSSGTQAVDKP
jgi:hypothetical protein